jgi:hypothetical protein
LYYCLVSMLGCILKRDISLLGKFFPKKEFYFLIEHFLRNWQLLSVFWEQFYLKFISDPELLGFGSGMFFSGS